MSIEMTSSTRIEGQHGSYGIVRQLWSTPRHGVVAQYRVTVPHPIPMDRTVAETTIYDTEEQARAVWDLRLPDPEPGLWTNGRMSLTWSRTPMHRQGDL